MNNINMKYQKKLNLLSEAGDSKFVTREWNTPSDQSNANYSVGNEMIYSTYVLKHNRCNYYDAYIIVRSTQHHYYRIQSCD